MYIIAVMKRILYKYILVTIFVLIFWLGVLPFIFSKAVPVVCENLTYNTEYNVKVKNVRIQTSIIPIALIKADEINVSSKKDSNNIKIDNLKLKIRILPLLSGKIHINELNFLSIQGNIEQKNDIIINKDLVSDIQNSKFICDSVSVQNADIIINNIQSNQKIKYSAKRIFYKLNRRYLKIDIDSKITVNNVVSGIKLKTYLPRDNNLSTSLMDIRVSNFDISVFSDIIKKYYLNDLIDIQGLVNIDFNNKHLNADFNNVFLKMSDADKSVILPENLQVVSDISLTSKKVLIKNAQILSKNINVIINGSISDYLAKRIPETDINIRINKSKIEDFIGMLPIFKTEDIDSYKLKKYKFYGDIIGNLSIKGDNLEPSILGSIYIDNGVLTKPIPNAKGATVKLDFKGKYLNYDVNVPAGQNEKVMVKGGVELYNVKYADMRVWSTKNVDLATAEDKVVPLHEILNFVIGPVPIMDITGRGNIDIIIKGNRKNPHVWGDLIFKDTTAKFKEMPDLILTNADAVLNFDDENAVFKLKKGFVDKRDINIDGTCNLAGKFDFDVKIQGQELAHLYKAIETSTIINDIKNMIPKAEDLKGLVNVSLKVYGNIKDIEYTKFNENFFVKGFMELLGNSLKLQGVKIDSAKGKINFNNTNADIDLLSYIGNSPLNVQAVVNDKYADANISIPKLNLRDIISSNETFKQDFANIFVNVNAKYKGATDKIEYENIDFFAKIIEVGKNNKLNISKGTIILKNGKLVIKDLNGNFTGTKSSFNVNLQADNITKNPVFNGRMLLKDFELNLLNLLAEINIIPNECRDIINNVKFNKGKINTDIKVSNNNFNASTNIGGIELIYVPLNLPIKIINGSIYLRKHFLGLNKINLIADNMPILIDGGISNIFKTQDFDITINSKPNQDFVDKYINNNRIYPLKLKGDIVYNVNLKGLKDNFHLDSEINLSKDSSVYYLGATVGDVENAIIMNLKADILKQTIIKIKDFSYDKLIDSQGKRRTRLNMLKASGGLELLKDDLRYKDLRVKTSHPTDVRILNILFRKPNIKQGQFTSDLRFNGSLSNPHLIGTFNIVETNIPFLDIIMKKLSFVFKDKTIDIVSNGEVLGNDVNFKGTLRNKLIPPYYIENAKVDTKILDFNYITNKLKSVQINESSTLDSFGTFNLNDTVINNLKINADEIRLRNLIAQNVNAKLYLSDKKVFNISNFNFDIANGTLNGSFLYNLNNSNAGIKIKAKNINANDMSIALFDLGNQIYGDLTGEVEISCVGSDFNKCMQTLNGAMMFDVKDGRMPKLGSLEYLLRAGNVLKGGLTGLSINSVIDILTPLKTGDFSEIYGKMSIKDGITNDIEISSKGKDLSIFITGSYNFASANAEMEVLGLLSKKISTLFGPLGNVSLNTLLNVVPGVDLAKDSKLLEKINKIPGIEFNSKSFRKFIAEINGNINGDNYVRSFKWIN